MMAMDFDRRVAIVTGAGRGLGYAHAKMLAERRCRVVINDLDERVARDAADQIVAAGGEAIADGHDIVTEAAAVIGTAIEAFGQLDIIVNNAGILDEKIFAETPPAQFRKVVDTHFTGTVEICRAAWPHLTRSPAARIINTSSSSMLGNTGLVAYGSAKAAIFGLTKALAAEGAAVGIQVNCIMPSAWTRMTEEIDDPSIQATLQRSFQPEHVAALVAYLAHQDTDVTNEAFRVSGGSAARVQLAMRPIVPVKESTPEAWSAVFGQMFEGDGTLTAVTTNSEMFFNELRDADPTLGARLFGEGETLDFKTVTQAV
jgi:NAD(P)-dependent dehydrogenase (short-subunit alcohol dehydrogenase family)